MKSRLFPLIVAGSIWLVACTSVRQTKPLAYAGDGRSTVDSIAAVAKNKGYEPVVSEREFCKFKYKGRVWIHYKARPDKVMLAVDVIDGKNLPKAEVDALFNEATLVAEEIWREASAAATDNAKRAEESRRAEEAARKEAERKEAEAKASASNKDGSTGNGGGILGTLGAVTGAVNTVSGALSGGAPAGPTSGPTQSYCCVQKQYFDCPTPAAMKKGCGDLAACMTGCMSSSSMGCPDDCLKKYPPDVSDCKRESSRDGQCR